MVTESVWGVCGLRHSLPQAGERDTCSPECREESFGLLVQRRELWFVGAGGREGGRLTVS